MTHLNNVYLNPKFKNHPWLAILLLIYIFSLPFKDYIPRMPLMNFVSVAVFFKFLILGVLMIKIILGKRKFIEHKEYLYLLSFFLIALVSTIWAKDLGLSLRFIWRLFHLLILYFLITQVIDTKEKLKWTILILILSGLVISLIGFREHYLGVARIRSLIGEPNSLASFLIFLIPLNYYLFRFYKSLKKIILFLSFLILNLAFIFTNSRGAVIAWFLIFVLIFLKEKQKSRFLMLFISFLLICLPFIPTTFWLRVGTISGLGSSAEIIKLETGTIKQRAEILYTGFKMFLDNFLTGVGIGNFKIRFPEYITTSLSFSYGSMKRVAHNIFIEIGAELGIFGLFTFLFLILNTFKILALFKIKFLKNKELSDIMDGLKLSFIGVLVTGLFLSIEWDFWFWLSLAITTSLKNLNNEV